jgi:drug/metabolite transporter (DMT)-like permease
VRDVGYALARTTAGRMGATLYLVTPIAVLLGRLLLGEAPPAAALAGDALCLAGVYISARSASSVSASSGRLSGRYRFTRANRSATPPG